MSLLGYAKGCTFCFLLFFAAFFGLVFIMFPSLIFLLLKKNNWFRMWNDYWGGFWLTLPGALFEIIHGTKFVMHGDKLDQGDNVLIIVNHRCRLDWMLYWMAVIRIGRLHNEKIIMKNELKHVPGAGWCMQYMLYCFLQRKWEVDRGYLERYVDYFVDTKYPLQFFLFPEGTDFCAKTKAHSDNYAEKNGLPKYNFVLHPRTTGFNYLVQKTRGKIVNYVYDVTMGFPVNLCYGEIDLLKGDFPDEVHLYFKRYRISDLPDEDEALGKWCCDRFAEKEERLKNFYQDGKFTGPNTQQSVTNRLQEDHTLVTNYISLMFWVAFVFYSFYLVSSSTFVMWYTLVVVVAHAILSYYKGMDALFLDFHDKEKCKQK